MNNIPSKFWNAATGLLGILFIFVLILAIQHIKEIRYVGSADTTSTINVDGSAHIVAVPDIATFSFTVTETAKTVAEAQTKATTKINNALKTLRDQGIADKDISTQSYNINPHYEYQRSVCPASSTGAVIYCPEGKSVLTGYDVSQTVEVKVRDLTKAGTILTSIGSLGVQNVNSLQFSVDEPNKVKAEARSKAIAAAKEKADVLAKQLGVRLVRVISFSESDGYYPPRPVYNAYGKGGADMAVQSAPEIPAGEQKVTSQVSITYEIQ